MKTADTGKISVIMGVFYRRPDTALLERSVRSILAQTYRDFEFLICDDGSTWEAMTLLKQFEKQDSRVRLVRGIEATDLSSKLNACLHLAQGTYIARMDDDDWSAPDRLEKQIQALESRPDIAFVGSNVLLCRDGENCGERRFPEYPQVEDFYMTQPYIHPSLMFRKEALDSVGGYSEDERQILCEDYDLLLRLYAKGLRGMNLQESLLTYSIPTAAKGNRKMRHRWNETVTRYARFRELGALPKAWPYVLKPLAVGLFPPETLQKIKAQREKRCSDGSTAQN